MCPEAGLKKRELRDGMPYRTWAEQGFLELCEGNVIDYREVKARLIWGVQTFDSGKSALTLITPGNSQPT